MRGVCLALAAAGCGAVMVPACLAQSSFIAPDGHNRFPGVTVFCPNGNGVLPCNFAGSGGGGGTVTVNLGGAAVGAGNRFPVTDPALDALIAGGALAVGGSLAVTSLPALPAGDNGIGSVSITGIPTVSVSGTASVAIAGGVGVSSLPALPAGANTIGSVGITGVAAVSVSGTPTVGLSGLSVGSVTAAGAGGSLAQAVQGISGGVAVPVSGTFWPATEPVSAASLPLPAGAATYAGQSAVLGPVAPAGATATSSEVVGCQAATTLPSFTAGQQGAVPCDTSGRLYVVTVPSANNVPGYLQAVTAGGASTFAAVNAAGSCMAASVKSSSGMVFAYAISNSNSSPVWVRLFASGSAPSCGAGTPVERILVPAGASLALSSDLGWVFANGIGVDVTSGSGADTDSTTVATANSVFVNIDYK